jgi:hypothetical protein
MNPEKPDFFLSIPGGFDSLDSSENLLDAGMLSILDKLGFSPIRVGTDGAVREPLAEIEEVPRGSGLECDSGGGAEGAGGAGR